MKFGAFDHIDGGLGSIADQYEERLQLVEAYERADCFHAFHMAEHHGTPLGVAPSPPLFLAAVAQRTTKLRFGAMVFTLAMYHPYRFYEEICMLDQLSRGRLELGIGRGVSPIELSFLGVDSDRADGIFSESLEILTRCFSGADRLNFKGKHFQFEDVPIEIRPYQQPRPPLWYGISNPDRTVWAAEHAVNLMTNQRAGAARVVYNRFRSEWAKADRDPATFPFFGSTKHVVVADTDAEALALARTAYTLYTERTNHLWRRYNIARPNQWFDDFDEARAGGLLFAGSPATVRSQLADFISESGINYLACRVAFGDLSLAASLNSLDLLTRRVLPDLVELDIAAA